MTEQAIQKSDPIVALEAAIAAGDLSKLTPAQRVTLYDDTCKSLGLNPYTKPFEYITLNNKLTLYATKAATDQLRKIHNVSVEIVKTEEVGDTYRVTAVATDQTGRRDVEIGVVSIGNLKGDQLANAIMKGWTKAKRRATLSIVGLGWLDETEIETIPTAQRVTVSDVPQVEAPKPTNGAASKANKPPAPVAEGRNFYRCGNCRKGIHAGKDKDGKFVPALTIAEWSIGKYGVQLCPECISGVRDGSITLAAHAEMGEPQGGAAATDGR